ncbi:MAG: hypothetical protein Q8P49_03305, partial [Candidatus Liptonbacteria bacterium]|nr:hypothetical protein [Candidatus Liptonbacteria bacterium]
MLQIIFWTVVLSAVAGLIAKFCLDRSDRLEEITWKEFAIGMMVIVFLVAPGVTKIGFEIAKSNLVEYNEYWNGWELRAVRQDITCTRDGSCEHCYNCDPYTVIVPYSCNCDNKGNCQTCFRTETHYHSCPYVDVEMTYVVRTTLGEYVIGAHRFPDNPQAHRWRKSEDIPYSVTQRAGVGAPPFW